MAPRMRLTKFLMNEARRLKQTQLYFKNHTYWGSTAHFYRRKARAQVAAMLNEKKSLRIRAFKAMNAGHPSPAYAIENGAV